MDTETKRGYQTGAITAGAGAAAAGLPTVANRSKGALVRRNMTRKVGNLGGLTAEGAPVNPFGLSGKRGGKDAAGRRKPSARAAASQRYSEAAKPFHSKLAKPVIGGGKAKALRYGGALVGAYGAGEFLGTGVGHGASTALNREKVRKDSALMMDSPQYGVGIPATRLNPISPLTMFASSSIMADFLVGASGRRLKRGEKKKLRRGAYGFAGAGGMLHSPLGMGMSTR